MHLSREFYKRKNWTNMENYPFYHERKKKHSPQYFSANLHLECCKHILNNLYCSKYMFVCVLWAGSIGARTYHSIYNIYTCRYKRISYIIKTSSARSRIFRTVILHALRWVGIDYIFQHALSPDLNPKYLASRIIYTLIC